MTNFSQNQDSSFKHKLAKLGSAFLRQLPAEMAHNIGMKLLNSNSFSKLLPVLDSFNDVGLSCNIPGLGELQHPIGLAAGFDKNATALKGLSRIGYSFLEVGTVTPVAQAGNPKPRMFRLNDQCGIINRMGFNNDGAAKVAQRLAARNDSRNILPIGINLGKNKITPSEDAINDYLQGFEYFKNSADYFVINVSSPNTPGLRDLASPKFLQQLSFEFGNSVAKLWVKLDPDQSKADFQKNISTLCEIGVQGVILTNTHSVRAPHKGGQSGHVLSTMSNKCLEWAYEVHQGSLPMIAVGGILSGSDVVQKIMRGACAVQIYTAFIYRGPWVVYYLLAEIKAELELMGVEELSSLKNSYWS